MGYKARSKQYVTNSLKQPLYYYKDDYVIMNLNSCITKRDNYTKFVTALKEIENVEKVNLCNLASLCYKFEIPYASQETLDLVTKIKELIIKDTDLKITQDNIENCGEIDMQPIKQLAAFDKVNDVIYTNSILLEALKILGYTENQLYDIIDFTKDMREVLPQDIIDTLPIVSGRNNGCYKLIKEIVCSQDTSLMKN